MRKIFERMKPENIRIFFTVFAVLVFLLCFHNFLRFMIFETTGNDQCAWRQIGTQTNRLLVTDVVSGGVADVAGVKDNDTLVAINAKTFSSPNDAQPIINRVPAGGFAMYTI